MWATPPWPSLFPKSYGQRHFLYPTLRPHLPERQNKRPSPRWPCQKTIRRKCSSIGPFVWVKRVKHKSENSLDQGTNPNVRDPRTQETPLTNAVRIGNYGTIDLLLRRGADTEFKGPGGRTALMVAARGRYSMGRTVRRLLLAGGKVDGTDNDGNTPLIVLAMSMIPRGGEYRLYEDVPSSMANFRRVNSNKLDILQQLIAAGANINGANRRGETALMQCAGGSIDNSQPHFEEDSFEGDMTKPTPKDFQDCCPTNMVLSLIESGANINKKNKEGKTALDIVTHINGTASNPKLRGQCQKVEFILRDVAKGGVLGTVVERMRSMLSTVGHTGAVPGIPQNSDVDSSPRHLNKNTGGQSEGPGTGSKSSEDAAIGR